MANTQKASSGNGLFGAPVSGDDPAEVARLKAQLQVEKDNHRVLVEKVRNVEKNQIDKDAAAALQKLETFEEDAAEDSPAKP